MIIIEENLLLFHDCFKTIVKASSELLESFFVWNCFASFFRVEYHFCQYSKKDLHSLKGEFYFCMSQQILKIHATIQQLTNLDTNLKKLASFAPFVFFNGRVFPFMVVGRPSMPLPWVSVAPLYVMFFLIYLLMQSNKASTKFSIFVKDFWLRDLACTSINNLQNFVSGPILLCCTTTKSTN